MLHRGIELILDEAKDAMDEAKAGAQGTAKRFAKTSIDKDTIWLLRNRENDAFGRYQVRPRPSHSWSLKSF